MLREKKINVKVSVWKTKLSTQRVLHARAKNKKVHKAISVCEYSANIFIIFMVHRIL